MNSKTIGIIVAFTALTTALNVIKIPVPYLLTFSYTLGDIALLVAFLLYGPKPGIAVAVLSTIITMIILPGPANLFGQPYYLIGICTMLLGVYIAFRMITRRKELQVSGKIVILLTALAILTRTLLMFPLDYTVFGALVSVVSGLSMADAYSLVRGTIPMIVLYNITVPLYAVPTSYYLAKKLAKYLKIQNTMLFHPEPFPAEQVYQKNAQ